MQEVREKSATRTRTRTTLLRGLAECSKGGAGFSSYHRYVGKELDVLRHKKAEFVQGLPLLHKESVEFSIRQFCDIARMRFERCATFDDKRQFLVDHVERVIYDRYRVTVIGSVPIKMQFGNSQEIETRKLAFCLRGEIDRTILHKKPRRKFAEDGRLRAYRASKEPSPSAPIPAYSLPSLTTAHTPTT